ncbi:Uncharacterized protein FKW44_024784 [Caligus rogercresseyi]|uniref:Uncharacterized protein n=1 Tax=Caligus rogercresseyi TaxID=217165 RepID=A0A7T8GM32_CALRO|nr:Uncharacterized protein FKW44_024784 [Caligus rogercresseyi]
MSMQVLPWIEKQEWEDSYCFQQDGAPSHIAKLVQDCVIVHLSTSGQEYVATFLTRLESFGLFNLVNSGEEGVHEKP